MAWLEDVANAVGEAATDFVDVAGEVFEVVVEGGEQFVKDAVETGEQIVEDAQQAGAAFWNAAVAFYDDAAANGRKVIEAMLCPLEDLGFLPEGSCEALADTILPDVPDGDDRPTKIWRPQYHFTPADGWMNDPAGLVYYNNEFHLFYQYLPYDDEHNRDFSFPVYAGKVCWGHAVSSDLLDWDHLQLALEPDWLLGTPFTGSAVVDGALFVAVFTHNSFPAVQRQSLAFSSGSVETLHPYARNPVLENPGSIHFRDPHVYYHKDFGRWIMSLAAGSAVRFYTSVDLVAWRSLGTTNTDFQIYSGSNILGPFVECPNLFELPVISEAGIPPANSRWILVYSEGFAPATKLTSVFYRIGRFDNTGFHPTDNGPRRLDHGPDFYAPQLWSHTIDDRKIIAAWMNNWAYAERIPTRPWRGNLSIPRELQLVWDGSTYHLLQYPVNEVIGLRDTSRAVRDENEPLNGDLSFGLTNMQLDIEVAFDVKQAQEVGVQISTVNASTRIGWSKSREHLFIDRRGAGVDDFDPRFESAGSDNGLIEAPLSLTNGRLRLRILVDKSTVEVFANGGQVVMSVLIFPRQEGQAVNLFSNGRAEIVSLSIYPMASVWTP